MKKIRGQKKKGTTVSLEIFRRYTPAPFKKQLERDFVADHSVRARAMCSMIKMTGYISLRIFNETTRQEMDRALIALKQQGMQSLVLDLQGNGGGYVQAAIGVADEFLAEGQAGVLQRGSRTKARIITTPAGFAQFRRAGWRCSWQTVQSTASGCRKYSPARSRI